MDFIKRVEQKAPLSCDTVLKILYQTCRAVQHMHKQKPPIIHRDLKVSRVNDISKAAESIHNMQCPSIKANTLI